MKQILIRLLLTALLPIAGLHSASAESHRMIFGSGIDPAFAPIYIAKSAGLFEKNGIDVQVNTGPSGSAMVPFLIKNQIQAVIAAEQAGIQSFNLDKNVVVAAETASLDNWYGLTARSGSTIEQLKGKRVGVSLGSGSEVFWRALVQKMNLSQENFKVVNVDPPEMVAALERGDIDAFAAWEPWNSRAAAAVPGARVVQTNWGVMVPRIYLYINRQWAVENPRTADKLMKSLLQASDMLRSDPARATKYTADFLKLDTAQTALFLSKLTIDILLNKSSIDHFKEIESQLKASGKLAKPVDWNAFIYSDVLHRVAPDRVKNVGTK